METDGPRGACPGTLSHQQGLGPLERTGRGVGGPMRARDHVPQEDKSETALRWLL